MNSGKWMFALVWTVIAAVLAVVIGMAATVDMQYHGDEPFEVHNRYTVRVFPGSHVQAIAGTSDGYFNLVGSLGEKPLSAEPTFNSAGPAFVLQQKYNLSGEHFVVKNATSTVRLQVQPRDDGSVTVRTYPSASEKADILTIDAVAVGVIWMIVMSLILHKE